MDTNAAKRIVRETFQNPFDKERFTKLVKELFNKIEVATFVYRGNTVPQAYQPFIHTLERLGKYTDAEGNRLDILIVRLKKVKSIEHARTMQRNFIAWYLNGSRGGELKDAAIVAFYTDDSEDWRFSLIKMDYQLGKDAKGKSKVTKELTPAKRFSFLVGKNENSHTAQKQLLPILEDDEHGPLLSDLETAFNIEIVTKEFFGKYRELFLKVKEALDKVLEADSKIKAEFSSKAVDTADFAKKLLGQIVFLYFLQKKGWFGVKKNQEWGTGSKTFLRDLFDGKIVQYKNFFNEVLEPLFYDALALDRSHDDHWNNYLQCKIPFLNGGLFDPIRNYDWVHTDIELPNELFSNTIKDLKTGDVGNGVLDIFDRYNFTVKEDEPLEKEVAVDPEMLGKVFENLLEVKDRKSKGTYYTPREIVHYMCQQSLINYLATEFEGNIPREDIEHLVKYGELVAENEAQVEKLGKETDTYYHQLSENIYHSAADIDYKLANIKVCDPAIGSGAFPVGMMSEIVKARHTLSNYMPAPRADQMVAYEESRTIYNFKRDCIQNSLYGVDIDPGAVEIAKLRLWLSLIVDEEDIKDIKPLPNLDYKIMQGNSLLEEFEGIKLFDEKLLESPIIDSRIFQPDNQKIITLQNDLLKHYMKNPEWMKNKDAVKPLEVVNMETQLRAILKEKKRLPNNSTEQKDLFASVAESKQIRDELENLHKKFFEETNKSAKEQLKKRIENLEWDLIEASLEEHEKKSKLKNLEKLRQANAKPFFLWKLNFAEVFQEKGGFDIFIANPPYDVLEDSEEGDDLKKDFANQVRNSKQFIYSLGGKLNLYRLFIEKAFSLLKKSGVQTYIVPSTILSDKSTANLRKMFAQDSRVDFFIEIPEKTKVFENVTQAVAVFLIQKTNLQNQTFKLSINMQSKTINLDSAISLSWPDIEKISGKDLSIPLVSNQKQFDILTKLHKQTVPLSSFTKIAQGDLNLTMHKSFIVDKETGCLLVRGEHIQRFVVDLSDTNKDRRWVNMEKLKSELPAKKLVILQKDCSQERIVCQNIANMGLSKRIVLGLIPAQVLVGHSAEFIYPIHDDAWETKVIFAILSSKLLNWRFKKTSTNNHVNVYELENLPFVPISKKEQKPFSELAEQILLIANSKDYFSDTTKQAKVHNLENEIDKMVYNLYGLTDEEIKIIESET